MTDGRLKIPAQHDDLVPAAHQPVALGDGFFQRCRAGEFVGGISEYQGFVGFAVEFNSSICGSGFSRDEIEKVRGAHPPAYGF